MWRSGARTSRPGFRFIAHRSSLAPCRPLASPVNFEITFGWEGVGASHENAAVKKEWVQPLALSALVLLPSCGLAQSVTFSGGPALPQGTMGERRAIGSQLGLGVGPAHERRGFTFRIDASYARFPTRGSYASSLPSPEGSLSVKSALGYLLYATSPGRPAWHGGVGAGVYDMNIPGRRNPYGKVVGAGLLVGAKFGTGRVRGLIELQQQVILSDYGTTEFSPSIFVPLRFGIILQ